MNTNLLVSSLSVLVLSTSTVSAANIAWVQTPFWTAPQVTEIQPALKSLHKGLEKNCQAYKKSMFNDNGSVRFPGDASYTDQVRKAEVQDYTRDHFEARFALSEFDADLDLSKESTVDESKEKLPLYSQFKTSTLTYPEEAKEIKIITGPDSYTALSRSQGLTDTEVSIEKFNYAPVLVIKGRDVACDLVSGKVRIEAKTSSQVALSDEAYSSLMNFYANKIQRDLNDVLVTGAKDSNLIKAARLGFRFGGRITDQNNNHHEVVEKQISEMMKLFFAPNTLNNSSHIIDMDGGKSKTIKISDSVDGLVVTLNIGLQN